MELMGLTRKATFTPTLQIAGAYTAGDVMGGLQTLNVHSGGGGGVLRALKIADKDNEKAALTLYFFDSSPTAIVDADPFTGVVDADALKLITKLNIAAADYTSVSTTFAYAYKAIDPGSIGGVDFVASAGLLYVYVTCDATPTYTAVGDLVFDLYYWPN